MVEIRIAPPSSGQLVELKNAPYRFEVAKELSILL